MSRLSKLFICAVLCFAAMKVGHLLYAVQYQTPESMFALNPIEMQKEQRTFKKTCQEKPVYRQYGNPKLIESLDTGRIRPKRRNQIRQQEVDKLQEQMNRFPDPALKKLAIKNLSKRILVLQKSMY